MKNNLGFSVVEVIVSVAVISILSTTLLPTIGWLVAKSHSNKSNQQAAILLMGGIEVAYNVLQSDWSIRQGEYHPAVGVGLSGQAVWTLVEGSEIGLEAKFDRVVKVLDVCRNEETGLELPCGGSATLDPNSKKIVTEVNWMESGVQKSMKTSLLIAYLDQ